jgi:hypothetical protein
MLKISLIAPGGVAKEKIKKDHLDMRPIEEWNDFS